MKLAPRRRFLISSLQLRLMLLNSAYMLALAFGLGLALFVPLIRRMQDTSLSPFERSEASGQLLVLYVRLWPGLALFGGLFLLHQVLVSHRIAGPLYNIRRVLKKVAKGELVERIQLREHDLLVEDEEAVNEMLSSLRGRVERTRESLDELRAAAAALESGARTGDAAQAEQWKALNEALILLEGELGSFDLGPNGRSSSRTSPAPGEALPRSRESQAA